MSIVIKTFTTPKGNYVFDRETCSLLAVSKDEFIVCKQIESGDSSSDTLKHLERYTTQGYFHESVLNEVKHPATDYLPYLLSGNISQLTMQITQTCNLRCTYCTYSGGYHGQRTHGNKSMTLETIHKCVDFIMSRSKYVSEIAIGFYGGESLLEFDLIKACLKYVKTKYKDRPVRYTVTTNGTLFNDEIVRFLSENDIMTNISLDGPKELHDINRVYADGKGSFDDIMENVRRIKTEYPDYFSKVSFMSIVAPGTDFACINNFFNADDVLKESNNSSFNTVSYYNAINTVSYDDSFLITHTFQTLKVLLSILGLYNKSKISKLYTIYLDSVNRIYKSLGKAKTAEVSHPGGPCLPGVMRPFVDIHGNIFPCERVSEGSDAMKIGHIDTGFDLDKATAILNVGNLTQNECSSCWAFSYCQLCAAACDDNGELSALTKLKNCEAVKHNILEQLKTICLLKEHNYDLREGIA